MFMFSKNPFNFVMNSETLIISCEMCDVELYVKVIITPTTNFRLIYRMCSVLRQRIHRQHVRNSVTRWLAHGHGLHV